MSPPDLPTQNVARPRGYAASEPSHNSAESPTGQEGRAGGLFGTADVVHHPIWAHRMVPAGAGSPAGQVRRRRQAGAVTQVNGPVA